MFTEFNFEATFNSFKNNGGTGRNVINFNSIPPLSSPYEECVFSELSFQSCNLIAISKLNLVLLTKGSLCFLGRFSSLLLG